MKQSIPPDRDQNPRSHSPGPGTIFKKTFWNLYDHLGKLLLLNFVSVLLALSIVGLPFAVAGLYGLSNDIAHYRSVGLSSYFRHGRRGYLTALKLTGVFLLGGLVLISNIVFHLQNRIGIPALSVGMLVVALWFSALFLAWSFYVFPLAFYVGAFSVPVAKSALGIVLDNKSLTAWVLLANFVNWFLGAATFVLLLFLTWAASAILQATAVREVLGRYQPGLVHDDEEQRTLRDLFKPWSY